VDLTSEGKVFIEEVYAQHEKDLEKVMSGLPEQERRVLYEGLKKIGFAAQAAAATERCETELKKQDTSA
jgi:MarR family transcriptional regulator, 2-MHQ and catechol-resistance regulon repressor